MKFALLTNKLTGNLDRLPVPLLSDPCLVFETFLAEMSELGSVGLLKTEIRQRGSGRGSAEGEGQGGSSANAALIKSFELHLSQESTPISTKSDITRQQLAYELNKNIKSTVSSE